jgi:Ni/Fe-hydrogenase subunit HybB-like protein
MATLRYKPFSLNSKPLVWAFVVAGALALAGLGAAYYIEHHGHVVTGMDNQVVWGMPHVFAVFLIVAASGALNVASMASVFDRAHYKPLARLSGLMAMALLMGGLAVLVLDLGRPDRLIVAMTTYNFKSIFAWNIFLYTGLLAIAAVYLWTMMEWRANRFAKIAGMAAFLWRLALTTGTGLIFGFLVARPGYDAALLAPLFIAMSFAFGLAVFILALIGLYKGDARPLGDAIVRRMGRLLGVFVAAVSYFVLVYHLTNLYAPEHHGFERYLLTDGGIVTAMFWVGQVAIGAVLPLILVFGVPAERLSRCRVMAACMLVILGGLAQLYVIIIGGQSYPMDLLAGWQATSSFFDGARSVYHASLPEVMLGVGGAGIAAVIVLAGAKVLALMPQTLADSDATN